MFRPSRRWPGPVIGLYSLTLLASFGLTVTWFASAGSRESLGQNSPEKLDPEHAAKMKAGLEVFQKEVRQVLVGRCVKCHGGDQTEGEFDLNTREALLKGGAEGPAVQIGKASASRLVRLIRHEEEPHMPEDGAKLPDRQIAAIAHWIDLGAPYDRPLIDKNVRPDAWIAKKIDDSARQFWSFQPLQPTPPPTLDNDSWSTTPIDKFVLAKLREKSLTPNSPTDRRRLIRRAYFDVLGLPPKPAEIEQFVNDPDHDAYRKLLDQLFDNPHYGERWGRHWLDTARFAESHGFEQDYDRPHAYHYRDFVIKALNSDLPYDQFVRWQIAGDEIAPDNPLALMATGFLGAGVFPTQLTEKEFEPARYDELDDMVSTLGTSMLGLTIGCARCHDHKYDPIPAADYYRMITTFATAIRGNVELDLDPQRTRAAQAQWQGEHDKLTAARTRFEQEKLPGLFDQWLKDRVQEAKQNDAKPGDKSGDKPGEAAPRKSADPAATGWLTLDLISAQSEGGAKLTRQPDGSWLATGANPEFDKYVLVAETRLASIRSIRLEALAHESMTKSGPGRAPNGNIGLGSLSVTAEPLDRSSPPVALKLTKPRATFEQNSGNLSIAAALDDDPKSGWAVDPQFGKNHAAAFELAEPVGFANGTRLTFTLQFTVNNKHNIGRPRLALTTSADPLPLDAPGQAQLVTEALAALGRGEGQLSADQRAQVLAWFRTTVPEWRQLNERLEAHLAQKPKPQSTQVMIVSEGVKPIPHHADGRGFPHFYKEVFYLKRGDAAQKQAPATPGVLQALQPASMSDDAAASLGRWQTPLAPNAKTSGRRQTLANWLTDTEQGAGQLLARVIVNRLWQHHLGRGIVGTPNDFGMQGQRPTHPELLDWLAAELIRNGWKLKPIHKLIMTSATYMQGSAFDPADARIDPENQWLWRRTPERLEAEVIRDNMLAASGLLDETMFGPGTLDESHKRRSIYFMIKRSRLIPTMQLFDAPEPLVSVGDRPSTTIAPQALLFMNNPQVRGYARALADRLAPEAKSTWDGAVATAYQTTLGRPPTDVEQRDATAFLDRQSASYEKSGKPAPRTAALADFCHVLFCLNEFIYVE